MGDEDKEVWEDTITECRLYGTLDEVAEPIFRAAVSEGRDRRDYRILRFFESDYSCEDAENLFHESYAGPFPDAKSCEAMKQHLQEADIGTRNCVNWDVYWYGEILSELEPQ